MWGKVSCLRKQNDSRDWTSSHHPSDLKNPALTTTPPHTPRTVIGNSEGRGLQKPELFKGKYKGINWYFKRGDQTTFQAILSTQGRGGGAQATAKIPRNGSKALSPWPISD